jgi:2-(1,2-epoxy-1,2-dihydrophenyl)acetyl-CoA isomerase
VPHRHILVEVSDGVATLTLNRPEKLNAYTTEMGDEVTAVLRGWRDDAAVRAVILTGAGRGFCAGVDLDHLKAHQAGANASSGPRLGEEDFLRKLPLEMAAYPKPLIAAVNGAAIGVGVTMILPCDVRVASENAKLGLAFVKLGILPGLGSTYLLPRIVGRAKALELVMSARTLSAQEAAACGLVSQVVPAEKLLAAARELATAIAAHRPEAVAAAKAAVNYGAEHTMEEAMRNEERASAELRALLARER